MLRKSERIRTVDQELFVEAREIGEIVAGLIRARITFG
jgi:hypothetical protein